MVSLLFVLLFLVIVTSPPRPCYSISTSCGQEQEHEYDEEDSPRLSPRTEDNRKRNNMANNTQSPPVAGPNCPKMNKINLMGSSTTSARRRIASTKTCTDSPLTMVSDSDEFRPGCNWVRRKPSLRCTRPGVSEHCPQTCKTCATCKDSPNGFYLPSGERKTCRFVAIKKRKRCKMQFYRDTCRLTCGLCNANDKKPNIMIIFADDIGTGDIPFYWNTGTSKVDMPNIQALASKGVMFTDAHSTPLCAQSRYMLLSGNYAHRGRLVEGTWGITSKHNQFRSHEMSIAKSLQNNGYHTAMFGKWHLGGKVPPDGMKSSSEILSSSQHNWAEPLIDGPQTIGFDESRITTQGIQNAPYSFFRNGYLETTAENIKFWEAGEYTMPQGTSMINEKFEGEGDISWDSSAYNMILVNETMDFLDDHLENRNDDPFFAYVALGAAHIPHTPPNFYLDGTPVKGTYATRHMDMLHELDKAVGSLVSAIEERNLADDTIIIFTSDNGGIGSSKYGSIAYGHKPSGPLQGSKGQIWEGGHRVPMIVRHDHHFPANEKRDHLVGLNDIYATLSELAGITVPYGSAYDSISFADYLYSKDATANLRESLGTWQTSLKSESAAIRFGEMKYIEFYEGSESPPRLHDLTSDISENKNLIKKKKYRTLKTQMKQKLDELSRNGPDAGYNFRISTGSGFQDEALSACTFMKNDPNNCNVYWEGLIHCRTTCHPDQY